MFNTTNYQTSGSNRGERAVLPLKTMCKSMICAVVVAIAKETFFFRVINVCGLMTENERHRGLLWHCPPNKKQSRQEAIEESLKIVIKVLKWSSLQLMTWGGGAQLSLRVWSLDLWLFQWVYRQYKLDLVYFFFAGGGNNGKRVDLGRIESKCDQRSLYEIPK